MPAGSVEVVRDGKKKGRRDFDPEHPWEAEGDRPDEMKSDHDRAIPSSAPDASDAFQLHFSWNEIAHRPSE